MRQQNPRLEGRLGALNGPIWQAKPTQTRGNTWEWEFPFHSLDEEASSCLGGTHNQFTNETLALPAWNGKGTTNAVRAKMEEAPVFIHVGSTHRRNTCMEIWKGTTKRGCRNRMKTGGIQEPSLLRSASDPLMFFQTEFPFCRGSLPSFWYGVSLMAS
ncbi:hypothetical protein VNO77_37791 [Canavalia gladiata]|uniref:Uncharacterized protein n=1 Tax=Canavalia gladiata TaxID=3824 RepID=A0AAN9KAD3_CANGL